MTTTTNYNSDSSTHSLFKQLEPQFNQFISTTHWYPYIEVRAECVQSVFFKKIKEEAKILAEYIAKKVIRRTSTEPRWSYLPHQRITLVHIIIEILFSRGIRRGSIPNDEKQLKLRESLIRNGLTHNDGLTFSILMLPCRDRNRAKNDGYLPDFGEIVSLLQLWCIVKAMMIATENYTQMLLKLFDKVVQPGVKTIIDFRNAIQKILIPKCHSTHTDIQTQECRIDILHQELSDDYIVLDFDKAELLLHELARIKCSIKWLIQTIDETFNATIKPIRIFVVQDGRRYASYDTFLDTHIEAYSTCLNEIAKQLGICNEVILTSHETLEQSWKIQQPQALETFLRKRQEIYSSKFEQLSKPFLQAKNELLMCNTRDSFLAKVRELSLNEIIPSMIEPILHSRYHPELAEAQLKPKDELKFLAQIYEPQQQNELLRQHVLFSSLINAIKYICSYESNTAAKNKYELDDLKFLLPGSVRLSIHNKSSNCEQFLIKIGPNLHRQPWQGTAGLRRSSKSTLAFEIRLSFEYKIDNYIPIFISQQQNNGCYFFFSELSRINQPILWIHPDLIQQYLSNVNVNNNCAHYEHILSQIFAQNNKIRLL